MVNQVWGKHATVVTGSQGSEQVSKNEWNENLNRKGLLGFSAETIASASAITIPDDTNDDVSSFIKLSGSTSIDTIVTTNTSEGDLLYIITTGSVTLNKIFTASGTHTAVQMSGTFNQLAVGGTIGHEAIFTPVTLASSDTLSVTWTLTLG